MNRATLRRHLDESKLINIPIQILILVSIVQVSLETVPDLGGEELKVLWGNLDLFFVIFFSLEYALRIYVAEKRWRFVFSFYGVIDLLAILPSLLSFGVVDFKFARSIRFLRLFRVFKLSRYFKAMGRLKSAFEEIKDDLVIFFFMSLILLYISAAGIYFFEHEIQPDSFRSIPHSMWWAVATLTTVGYGDIYPISLGGRIFTFFILMIGLGVIAVPSGLFADALRKCRRK
ncbi:MAG: ion transporter [Bacteriovoracales bacterium]|nr:ion transporter [Bacteriovoracales bacterium]